MKGHKTAPFVNVFSSFALTAVPRAARVPRSCKETAPASLFYCSPTIWPLRKRGSWGHSVLTLGKAGGL